MYLVVAHILFFFFNDTATTEIYTLSLHDALPICDAPPAPRRVDPGAEGVDDPGDLAARDRGELGEGERAARGLPAAQGRVEQVDAVRAHGDADLARAGHGVGHLLEHEVLGRAEGVQADGVHGSSSGGGGPASLEPQQTLRSSPGVPGREEPRPCPTTPPVRASSSRSASSRRAAASPCPRCTSTSARGSSRAGAPPATSGASRARRSGASRSSARRSAWASRSRGSARRSRPCPATGRRRRRTGTGSRRGGTPTSTPGSSSSRGCATTSRTASAAGASRCASACSSTRTTRSARRARARARCSSRGSRTDRPRPVRATVTGRAPSPVLGAAAAVLARVRPAAGLVAVELAVLLLLAVGLVARLGALLLQALLTLGLLALRLALLVALRAVAGRVALLVALGALVALRPVAVLVVAVLLVGARVLGLLLLLLQALLRRRGLLLLLGGLLGLLAVGPAAHLLGRRVRPLGVGVPVVDVLAQGVRVHLGAVAVRVEDLLVVGEPGVARGERLLDGRELGGLAVAVGHVVVARELVREREVRLDGAPDLGRLALGEVVGLLQRRDRVVQRPRVARARVRRAGVEVRLPRLDEVQGALRAVGAR